jgi:geranylgeranyl reductase family protein
MYDVIVVGGGPMGSIASSLIAQNNFKVLLLEKHKHPRWKPCGECISIRGIELLQQFNLYEPIKNLLWSITGVSINIPQEEIVTKKYDKAVAYTLDRSRFDHALFEYAQEQGAEAHENESVINIKNLNESELCVKTTKKEYYSSIVIGADGVCSLVGRKLFRNWKKSEVALCKVARYKIPKKDQSFHSATMEYCFIEGGYGWVFPRIENKYLILNIGIGKIGEIKENLNTLFNNFIASLENEKKVKLKGKEIDGKTWGHLIPVQGPSRGTYSNNCLLVGDAGGFVNPLTGAGLHYGIISSILASEVAIQFLNNEIESLELYEKKWQNEIMPIFDKALDAREKLYFIKPVQLLTQIQKYSEVKEGLLQSFIGKGI